jgi:hypothetical protein
MKRRDGDLPAGMSKSCGAEGRGRVGMKRIERIRKSVGRGIGEEIDGLMRRKGGTEGRMWQRCGGSGGGCGGYVGVCVCGLQISARESGTPHTKNLRHSTKRELLAAVSPFAIVSYLANN